MIGKRLMMGTSGRVVATVPSGGSFNGIFGSDGTVTGSTLVDLSGSGNDFTVISGTTPSDLVISAPAGNADLIAADTTNIFYASDGTPKNVTWANLLHNADNRIFAGDAGLEIYATSQTDAAAATIEANVGNGYWFGGTFTFGASAAATENILIDTVDSANWMLNGVSVPSGSNTVSDTSEGCYFGVSDVNNIDFFNIYAVYLEGSWSQLSDWRINSVNIGKITGDITPLANWGITGNVTMVWTTISSLEPFSSWRPTGNVDIGGTKVSDCSPISAWRPTGYFYAPKATITTLDPFADWRPTGGISLYSNSITTISSIIANLFSVSSNIKLYDNSLDQTSVDNVLAAVVAGGVTNGSLRLEGGTNATPSAAGLADVGTLESRGWTVTHN